MKKKFLSIIALIALSGTIHAQTGDVGIGTTTPTAKLHVNGNVRIVDGTQGASKVFTSDANGLGSWQPPAAAPGAISGVYEVIGTTEQTIAEGITADLNGTSLTISLTKPSTLLITYSALGVPAAFSQPVQGSIDLLVDGVKQISSYYSGADAPPEVPAAAFGRLGNYSTAQKVVTLGVGSHVIKLQAKSWHHSTIFNRDAFPSYAGALATDGNAMKSRISVIVFNN